MLAPMSSLDITRLIRRASKSIAGRSSFTPRATFCEGITVPPWMTATWLGLRLGRSRQFGLVVEVRRASIFGQESEIQPMNERSERREARMGKDDNGNSLDRRIFLGA